MQNQGRYIYTNGHSHIIDLFHARQEEKFVNGNAIFFDNHIDQGHKIFGKNITDKYGTPVFIFINSHPYERPIEDIEDESLVAYKKIKKELFMNILKDYWLETSRTQEELKARWQLFKTNHSSLTTKEEVDTLFNQAVTWLQG